MCQIFYSTLYDEPNDSDFEMKKKQYVMNLSLSKKTIYAIILTLAFSFSARGQHSFDGKLFDSLDFKNVAFASVSLLKESDSSLIAFTRSNPKGEFEIKNLKPGDYILLIAHNKYFIYSDNLRLDSDLNFGEIQLFQKQKMLKEVMIKANSAITIRGDTIKYYADSFQTKQGAVVEDLLKKLPGMEVDQNGNIKSQGKEVKKVFVNGEEFFGADPTIATKNLPSKAVENVVVYDYKDEQESFTGFTKDEEKTKVIDLKLKKEMNKGGFMKAKLAGNLNDRWEQKLMINRFVDKEQMGAYYLASSNEMAELGWDEGQDFGTSSSSYRDGMYYTSMNNQGDGMGNPFQGNAQYGITKSWKAGGRYANKFEKNKQSFNSTYSFLRATRNRNFQRFTENLVPGAQFNKIDSSTQFSESNGHNFSARYKIEIDSLSSISFKTSIRSRNNQINEESSYYNNTSEEVPLSFNRRTSEGDSRRNSIDNTLNLKKKFNLKGRTISLRLNQRSRTTNGQFSNESTNALDLQNNGNVFFLDQENTRDQANRSYGSNLVFTEPLSERIRLKLSYQLNFNRNENKNLIKDTTGFSEGKYLNQIDSLSNIFLSNQTTHRPGFELRYEKDQWRITLRNSLSLNQFNQEDLIRDQNFDFKQTNLIPGFSARYKITKYKNFSFNYSGNTQSPQPNQVQPYPDITNPLNIIIGNPNLRMSYRQRISLSYSGYSPLDGNNFYVVMAVNHGINNIGTSRVFEESGRTSTTYVNLPNSYAMNTYSYISMRIKDSKFSIGTSVDADYDYNPNVINEVDGFNERVNIGARPTLSYDNEDLLEFRIAAGFNWNSNSNNLRNTIQYLDFSPRISTVFYFPNFFTLSSSIRYDYSPAVAPYTTPFTRLFGTMEIEKRVLKDRSLELYFNAFDLFNQNKGYDRASNINYNSESFYNTLGRYFMLGARWTMFSGPGYEGKKASTENTGKGWSKGLAESE